MRRGADTHPTHPATRKYSRWFGCSVKAAGLSRGSSLGLRSAPPYILEGRREIQSDDAVLRWPLLALFGHGAMSDLSLLSGV
jgi:hypothetical protein